MVLLVRVVRGTTLYNMYVYSFRIWILCFLFQFLVFSDLFVVSVSVVVVRVVSVFVGCMWYIETYSRHIVDIDSFMWVPFSKQYCRGKKVVNVSFCNSSRDICEYFG